MLLGQLGNQLLHALLNLIQGLRHYEIGGPLSKTTMMMLLLIREKSEENKKAGGVDVYKRQLYNRVRTLIDAVFRHKASHHRKRIDIGVAADHCSRIQYRVATHLYKIAKHCPEFLTSSFYTCVAHTYCDQRFVRFNIRGDGTCTHMRLIAKNGVPHIIIVWYLYTIE